MGNASAFLIISSAVAGYIFATKCYKFKYKVARESGYKLYLTSVTFGFVFLFAAWTISEALFSLPQLLNFSPIFTIGETGEAVGVSVSAIAFSMLSALIYNGFVPLAREKNAYRVWKKNDYDSICFKAMVELKPIAISHESGKVYVGYVIDTMSPSEENAHLTILPIYSGYRATETLKFTLVSKYQYVIDLINNDDIGEEEKAIELEDFYMAFPRAKICSLHIFNDHLHRRVSEQYPSQSKAAEETQQAIEKARLTSQSKNPSD